MYAAFVLIIAALGCIKDVTAFDASLDGHWSLFLRFHAKIYVHEEESRRRGIWETNIGLINRHNLEFDLGLHSYRQGVNWYTDWSDEEVLVNFFEDYDFEDRGLDEGFSSWPLFDQPVPDSIDWRETGCIHEVKYIQRGCNASWAFFATDSVETYQCLKAGNSVPLSEQNLIDCSRPQGNNGCHGGTVVNSFLYIQQNGGIDTEGSYPYTGVEGPCRYNPSNSGATINGYVRLSSENFLQTAVGTTGPVSAVIDARPSFFRYRGGIYDDPDCSSTDVYFNVQVVGYGTTEHGQDYWIVKTNLGTNYGEDGYIRMSRNKNNQCGIATRASFPIVLSGHQKDQGKEWIKLPETPRLFF